MTVEDQVDAGIDLVVLDAGKPRDAGTPRRGFAPAKVMTSAGEFPDSFNAPVTAPRELQAENRIRRRPQRRAVPCQKQAEPVPAREKLDRRVALPLVDLEAKREALCFVTSAH